MTYIFDIDGTICNITGGDYEKAEPNEDRIEKINKLHEQGHTIIFHTARGMGRSENCAVTAHGLFFELTSKQLEEWDVKYHTLILGKPAGDLYVDDKGVNDEHFFSN
jgi:hypothetical protein